MALTVWNQYGSGNNSLKGLNSLPDVYTCVALMWIWLPFISSCKVKKGKWTLGCVGSTGLV